MLYRIIQFWLRIGIRMWIGRIQVNGLESVPSNAPIILAVNHPNSFLDAMIIASLLPRVLYFTVRSDVFKNPIANWALRTVYLMPVYRRQEGRENLKKNSGTFDRCKDILSENGGVLVFPEGLSIQEKRLRPLKKGAARIALEAYTERALDELFIVPIGINFSDPNFPDHPVSVGISAPIPVSNWSDQYQSNNSKAFTDLTKEIDKALQKQVVAIPNSALEKEMETALTLFRHEKLQLGKDWKQNSHEWIEQEQAFIEKAMPLVETQPALISQIQEYSYKLKEKKLQNEDLEEASPQSSLHFFLLLLYSPVFAILNLPRYLGRKIADKTVTAPEFYASIYFSVAWLLFLIQGLLLWIWVSTLWGWEAWIITLLAQMVSLVFLYHYRKSFAKVKNSYSKGKISPAEKETLLKLRKDIIKQLGL